MFGFTLSGKSTETETSKLISLYADPDSWFLAIALFQADGSSHLEYMGIKDIIFDWNLLECRRADGAEAADRTAVPSELLDLHELISSSIAFNENIIGTVRDAVIDESSLHIDAFLVDHHENDSSGILFLESDWCSWSRDGESYLSIRVPFEKVKSFLE